MTKSIPASPTSLKQLTRNFNLQGESLGLMWKPLKETDEALEYPGLSAEGLML